MNSWNAPLAPFQTCGVLHKEGSIERSTWNIEAQTKRRGPPERAKARTTYALLGCPCLRCVLLGCASLRAAVGRLSRCAWLWLKGFSSASFQSPRCTDCGLAELRFLRAPCGDIGQQDRGRPEEHRTFNAEPSTLKPRAG